MFERDLRWFNSIFVVILYGGDESNVPKTYVTYRQDLQDRSRPSRTGQGPPEASPGHPGAAPGPVLNWFQLVLVRF